MSTRKDRPIYRPSNLSFKVIYRFSIEMRNFSLSQLQQIKYVHFDCVYYTRFPHIVYALIHNITIIDMDPRHTKVSRSIFYRGISLKEYVRKSSVFNQNLQYPDDETILLDENKTPILIDDGFIHSEPSKPNDPQRLIEKTNTHWNPLPPQKSNIQLPSLQSKKKFKAHTHSYLTDRNSTETSIGSSFDLRLSVLPEIDKKEPSREKDNLVASRCGSKSVSHRKKQSEVIIALEQVEEEMAKEKDKPHISREYTEYMKKEIMMKHRYNIHGQIRPPNSKIRYFNRVKSHAE